MEEVIVCSDLHPDIELGFKRSMQKLYLELPENGINDDTGLIVFINDFNSDAEDEYPRKVLKPYLSNRFNCVVMDTNYFGLRSIGGIHPTKSLITNLNSIYATAIDPEPIVSSEDKDFQTEALLEMILEELGKRRITTLDPRCQFKIVRKDGGYESWGFIPAIDLLNAAGTVIEKYNLNRKKSIAYGLGYGGYVAKLMGKFAPNTFSVIIDKSGFSEVKINHIAGHELQEPDFMINLKNRAGEDVLFYLTYNNPWTIMDEESDFYFGDTHRLIRSITEDRHHVASETRYYIFHSVEDDIDPIGNCDKSTDVIKKYNKTFYERIDSSKLGKSIFNNCSHDLGVSTRGLFDYVAGLDTDHLVKDSEVNDFTMESEYRFDCGAREYIFKYTKDNILNVALAK